MTLDDERKLYLEMLSKGQVMEWFLNHFCYEMILEEHLLLLQQKKQQERHSNYPHTYYPNRLGYCMRNQQLSALYPTKTAIHLLKTFFYGDMIQDYQADVILIQWAERHKLGITKVERPFTIMVPRADGKATIFIDGRMDDLLVLKDDKGNIPIEIKSAKTIKNKRECSSTHRAQIAPYMIINHEQLSYVVYIDKQGSPETDAEPVSKTFREVFDQPLWDKLILILFYIDDATDHQQLVFAEGRLPAADGQKNEHAWECNPNYCHYYHWCHKQPIEQTACNFAQLTTKDVCK